MLDYYNIGLSTEMYFYSGADWLKLVSQSEGDERSVVSTTLLLAVIGVELLCLIVRSHVVCFTVIF